MQKPRCQPEPSLISWSEQPVIPTLQVLVVVRQDGTNRVHPHRHPSSAVKKRWISWLRLRLRLLAGKLYNLAGVPGIVRDCDYAATAHDVKIQVRARELFTIVTVNGLEIFFHRLTGTIDGVGISPTPECLQQAEVHGSMSLPEPSALQRHSAQKRTS
jgi:hypothetical protein